MSILSDVKILLGISAGETDKDSLLNLIISMTSSRLSIIYLGGQAVPSDLEYVVKEVAVRRFNRIASEGFDSHTVEGESIAVSKADFVDYADDIYAWIRAQDDIKSNRGRVRFI